MTTGWLKLHRSLLEKPVFEDAYTLQVLIYCLLKATYKEMAVRVGNQVIDLQPGQLLYGRKQVSQRLGMGEGKLRGIMDYLVQNGTVAIESHSRYSIVTIVNWEQYQKGEGEPEFPFDCDFLDGENDWQNENACPSCHLERNEAEQLCHPERNEVESKDPVLCGSTPENTTDSQPHRNHSVTQSGTGFPDLEEDFSASREPQYNNIKKYKNNNKQENKTKEKNQNKKTSEHLNRRIFDAADDCIPEQGERVLCSQQDDPSGGGVTKGESMCCELVEQVGADTSSEGLAALSMLDDAALETYFASCSYAAYDGIQADEWDGICAEDWGSVPQIPLDDTDMPSAQETYCRPGHEFAAEMTYSLTEQDIAQLEQMFSSSHVGRSTPAWPCEQLTLDTIAASDYSARASIDELDPDEQDYIAACQMFNRLWDRYPVKAGKEKVSAEQIMRLYEIGEKPLRQAIWNYQNKKYRVPKKYLMNGSTFFNGGYEKYLPAEKPATAGA